jgi:hypothetical protein
VLEHEEEKRDFQGQLTSLRQNARRQTRRASVLMLGKAETSVVAKQQARAFSKWRQHAQPRRARCDGS